MSRLNTALEAAVAAGDLLRRKLAGARAVRRKGLRDLVTDADVAAQDAILARLRADFPEDAVLSEEGRHDGDWNGLLDGQSPTWVVDPLDGTSNYARQVPLFGVSIGLVARGEPEIGVIYDPLRRELFYAERGQGAFLRAGRSRPRRLEVSAVTQLGEAVVGAGWPRDDVLRERTARLIARVGAGSHTLRLIGSAALNLAYVAAARLDASFHLSLQPWDVAAGAALVREAGGQLSALDGSAWQVRTPQILFSNGRLHPEMARVLAAA